MSKLVGTLALAVLVACGDADTTGITNRPPVARAGSDLVSEPGLRVRFDASASSDPDGEIESFHWDFGDGATSSESVAIHTFAAGGAFSARLTVKDDEGATATDELVATIVEKGNQPPVALIGGPSEAVVGTDVSFTATDSSDPDGTIATYAWLVDGIDAGTAGTLQRRFDRTGAFVIRLTVTDDDGATASDERTFRVRTTNEPPTAVLGGPASVVIGTDATWTAASSTDPEGPITAWAWTIDGTPVGTAQTLTHRFAAAGTYVVSLTVTDDDGATDSETLSVTAGTQTATLPASSVWDWDVVNESDRADGACGPFGSRPLTITWTGTTMRASEGSGYDYSGNWNATTRRFTVVHQQSIQGTDTIDATFSADFRRFEGTYAIEVSILGCNRVRAVSGTRR